MPFGITTFVLDSSQLILYNYFTERPTVKEFQDLKKHSPATAILVFWPFDEDEVGVWSFTNEMTFI